MKYFNSLKFIFIIFISAATFLPIKSFAADGVLDMAFRANSIVGANNSVNFIYQQPDGKIIIGGGFNTYNGSARSGIARINADGSLDTTFAVGAGGQITVPFPGVGSVYIAKVQSDGKLLIGGAFTKYNGTSINRIARVNTNGSTDTTFAPAGGANGIVDALDIQPSDGKIIIGGQFTTYNGTTVNRIARVNTDGSLDGTFVVGTGFNNTVTVVKLQPDGKVLVAGAFTSYNGTATSRIARLNSDGSLDTSFNLAGTGLNNSIGSTASNKPLALQSDGKIIVVGAFTTYNGIARNGIVRLNSDGSLDTSFNPGTGPSSTIFSVGLQSDGKIVIGGGFLTYNGSSSPYLTRLNTDGSIDSTFNVGTGPNQPLFSIDVQSDNNILIGGNPTSYNGTTTTIGKIGRVLVAPTYTVTYNGNTNTSGTVPTDSNNYYTSDSVTVLGNTGALTKTAYSFSGWNTVADGSGTSYAPGATFAMGSSNVTLYAQWTLIPTYTVSSGGIILVNNKTNSLSQNIIPINLLGGGEPNVPTEFQGQVCKRYMREYILPEGKNNPEEVKKLQIFLNDHGESLSVDGIYDVNDIEAVKRFQVKYKDQILSPWGIDVATGRVYRTTTAKINLMMCNDPKKQYFTEYLKEGDVSLESVKVQDFLNLIFSPISGYPNDGLPLTKTFTQQTVNKLKEFQLVYKKTVLDPWGLESATGRFY